MTKKHTFSAMLHVCGPIALTAAVWTCSMFLPSMTTQAAITTDGAFEYAVKTSQVEIQKYHGSGGAVTIPDTIEGHPVTFIGTDAFDGCTGITSLTIPEGVTVISSGAFRGCSQMTAITVPDSVVSFGSSAFEGCSGLTSLNVSDNVTYIGKEAFSGCSGLTDIHIPQKLTVIAYRQYYGCSGLSEITLPESLISINDSAFSGCSGLTKMDIPAGVTSIGNSAFRGCSGMSDITLHSGLLSIGKYIFYGCSSLRYVFIPDTVKSVGNYSFFGCQGLTEFQVDTRNRNYSSLDGALLNKEQSSVIRYPSGKSNSEYIVPEGIKAIGNDAFSGCNNLKTVTLSKGVSSIGDKAFANCTALSSLELPTSIKSIGSNAFENCTVLEKVTYAGTEAGFQKISMDDATKNQLVSLTAYQTDSKTSETESSKLTTKENQELSSSSVPIEWLVGGVLFAGVIGAVTGVLIVGKKKKTRLTGG